MNCTHFVGAGAAEGSIDASNMLKPALSRGEIQCIGATTLDEYRKHIEKDGALKRRFQPIHVQPPSIDETVLIIQGLRDRYEEHHGVEISEEAILEAVKLSDRYISDRFLPDKAIDLIDETGSRAKLQTYALPSELKAMEQELKKVSRDKELAISMQNFEEAVRHREEEERLRKLLDESKREWKKNQEKNKPTIGKEDVAYVVSKMTGIPLFKLEEEESNKLLRMEEFLHKRVVGQNEAISAVARAIRRSRAGLKEAKKPIGSFIFLGPTGVGKTELARTFAEFLFNSEDALIRIDMSEYQEKFTSSRLFGAPPGYVGYEEGGQLTETGPSSALFCGAVRRNRKGPSGRVQCPATSIGRRGADRQPRPQSRLQEYRHHHDLEYRDEDDSEGCLARIPEHGRRSGAPQEGRSVGRITPLVQPGVSEPDRRNRGLPSTGQRHISTLFSISCSGELNLRLLERVSRSRSRTTSSSG